MFISINFFKDIVLSLIFKIIFSLLLPFTVKVSNMSMVFTHTCALFALKF